MLGYILRIGLSYNALGSLFLISRCVANLASCASTDQNMNFRSHAWVIPFILSHAWVIPSTRSHAWVHSNSISCMSDCWPRCQPVYFCDTHCNAALTLYCCSANPNSCYYTVFIKWELQSADMGIRKTLSRDETDDFCRGSHTFFSGGPTLEKIDFSLSKQRKQSFR